MQTNPTLKAFALAAGLWVSASATQAQILSYNFDGSGANSGSGGSTYNLSVTNPAYTTGVGGKGQALDLSANTSVGGAALTYATTSTSVNLPAQTALTLTGWIRVDQAFTTTASVIIRNSTGSPTPTGFILGSSGSGSNVGALYLTIGTGSATTTIRSNYNTFGTSSQIGEWIFYAVTWDFASGAYSWYTGTESDAVSLVNSGTSATTMVSPTSQGFAAGRSNTGSGAFSGDLDNIELYGSVLNSTQLETLRTSAVPEPSTYALLASVGMAALFFLRRRRPAQRR